MRKLNHIIFCIIDDVRSSYFFNLIEQGLLPNFKKLMEEGLYSKNCITDFPSVTFPTQVSMITGTYTGDYRNEPCHGVPAFNWMDRTYAPPKLRSYGTYGSDQRIQIYKINEDLGKNCQTILEMVGDENTASITQFINRGTKYFYPERKTKLALYYLFLRKTRRLEHYSLKANTMVVYKLLDCFKNPRKYFGKNEKPMVSLLWFMSSDILMHLYGFNSIFYKNNLRHIDKVIGILLKGLRDLGLKDEVALAITSDHGNYEAKKIGDLTNFFKNKGLSHYHRRKNILGNMNIAEFTGIGMFNFKASKNSNNYRWDRPNNVELRSYGIKNINLFDEIMKIQGSKLMYHRIDGNNHNEGKIQLYRKRVDGKLTKALIYYEGTGKNFKTKYVPNNPDNDIFNYLNNENAAKLLDGKFHSIDEWLEATYNLNYPLYVDLLPRHFKNPRSADIIVSTQGDVIFNIKHGKKKAHGKFCHDIGLRKSSIVPLIFGGSEELPQREILSCKITDIVPTLLDTLGKKPHKSVVGKSLI